jgi:glycosyltransferase involved in cell wall biosynthesis
LKRKKGTKLIFNAHELETERNALNKILKTIYKVLEKKLIYNCDTVIVVSDSIKRWYCDKYNIENVICIYNTPRYKEFAKTDYFRKKYSIRKDNVIFLFQGMLFKGNGVELMLQAFDLMHDTNNYLIFMGKGPMEEAIRLESMHNNHIFLHEMVPQNELYKYTSSADFGFSIAEKTSLSYEYSMPNKLFEYIMYEIPVIVANTKEQFEFVRKYDIGYCLNEYEPKALVQLINSIDFSKYPIMVKRIKELKKIISWETQEEKLLNIYKEGL